MERLANPFPGNPPVMLRASWTAFSPVPDKVILTWMLNGTELLVRELPGSATQDDLAATEDPQLYAALVEPRYLPVPCTITVL